MIQLVLEAEDALKVTVLNSLIIHLIGNESGCATLAKEWLRMSTQFVKYSTLKFLRGTDLPTFQTLIRG